MNSPYKKPIRTMTKAQRAKIYRKAAEWLDRNFVVMSGWSTGCCYAILVAADLYSAYHVSAEAFPELYQMENGSNAWWWDREDRESRIIALLLCAEMCKSK